MDRKLKVNSSKKIMPKQISKSNRAISRIQPIQVSQQQTISRKEQSSKCQNPLDKLRTLSMINVDQPLHPIKSKKTIRYRKKASSIVQQPNLSAIKGRSKKKQMEKNYYPSVKMSSQSTRVGVALPKIEERMPKQILQKYIKCRPKTAISNRYSDEEELKKIVSSECEGSPSLPNHKKRICQCKIIKCPKLPFPIPRPQSRRQKIASNIDQLIAETDMISEIQANKNGMQQFVSAQSQFLINF